MVTDYDCWHPEHDAVTVEDIIANLTQNAANAAKLVHAAVAAMPAERTCKCGSALKHAIMTDPKTIPAPTRRNWSFWLENICREVLELCLDGQRVPDDLLRKALAQDEGRTFLSTVVEPLADSFEPHLCDVYAALFRRAVEIAEPELMPRVWRAPSGALPDLDPEHLDSVYVLIPCHAGCGCRRHQRRPRRGETKISGVPHHLRRLLEKLRIVCGGPANRALPDSLRPQR